MSVSSIVIAFPKKDVALNMKKILAQSGYSVTAVCSTGAQALAAMNDLEQGTLICANRFVDMMYTELYEYLPEGFQMLLIASAETLENRERENLVCLTLPFRVHELLDTMEMMEGRLLRRRKKEKKRKQRSEEETQLLNQAKALLMERNSMTEEEAHRYIQKRSMDNGTNAVETAQMILSLLAE